jgi:hypothetical protein
LTRGTSRWFGDYRPVGLPFVGRFFVVAVFLVPQVWAF